MLHGADTIADNCVCSGDRRDGYYPRKFDVEIDLCGRTKDININDSKTYYIYSSSSDPDFVWTKKIQINGKKAAPHIFWTTLTFR